MAFIIVRVWSDVREVERSVQPFAPTKTLKLSDDGYAVLGKCSHAG